MRRQDDVRCARRSETPRAIRPTRATAPAQLLAGCRPKRAMKAGRSAVCQELLVRCPRSDSVALLNPSVGHPVAVGVSSTPVEERWFEPSAIQKAMSTPSSEPPADAGVGKKPG